MPSKRSFASALSALFLLAACEPDTTSKFEFVAIGTVVTLTVYATPEETASNASNELEQLLNSAGKAWYPWADGELAEANRALSQGVMPVLSAELETLVLEAARIEELTDGRFNAAIGELVQAWGFDDVSTPPTQVPDPRRINAILERSPSLAGFSEGRAEPIIIDLGGIAKGALLNASARRLIAQDINNAIINLGGDLLVLGDADGRPVRIGIRSPFSDEALGGLSVKPGEAVISSGNYERFFDIDGQRYHHILDPATGYPVPHTAAVTVVHTDPILADAAATALLVGGAEHFDTLVEKLDLEYALLIPSSGDVVLTTGLRERLNWGME